MNRDTKFSRDRSAAPAPRARVVPRTADKIGLTLEKTPPKPGQPERSSDPYNSSGSFDRTKNWARVGKR